MGDRTSRGTLGVLAMRSLRVFFQLAASAALALSLAGCPKVAENVPLSPQGEQVEFAMETPSENLYAYAGDVVGEAAGKNVEEAEQSARNDVRNKAAAMGATLVVIDEDTGGMMLYTDKTKVTLRGRAFKSKE